MLKVHKTYALNEANVDNIAAQTDEVCQSLKMSSDQRIRVRLTIEEILLEWLKKSEEAIDVEFKAETQFFKPTITLSYASPTACNPLKADEFGTYFKSVFEQMTFLPSYTYEKGRNVISIRLQNPKINPILKLVLVMAVSLIVGFLGKLVLPQSFIAAAQEYLIGPTYEKFLDVLGCVAGPLIFFSVAWGIYGIGDTATLNKLGKGMIFRYLRDVLIAVVLCVVFFPIFGCVLSGGKVDFTQILSIYTMFLDMLPVTIIEPFSSGNTIQIIVLAVIIGITLIYLGKKTQAVAVAIEQINLLTTFLMEIISKLVPFFITLVLINMVWSDTLNTLTASWWFILI